VRRVSSWATVSHNHFVHIFMVDETNRNYVENHFFIVGGLVITDDQVDQVNSAVASRRAQGGFRNGDSFKFDTNSRPAYVDAAAHRDAKRDLVIDLERIGVRLLVSVVLHDLCMSQDYSTRMDWALNTLAGAYRKLLKVEHSQGILLMDRDNDRFDHLEYLFQHGLRMHTGSNIAVDDRIRLFGMTSDNASNLSSAADIALGAFRYCVNTAVGAGREPVANEMFPSLARLMWGQPVQGIDMKFGFGYSPRPRIDQIRVPDMRLRYESLATALAQYALDPVSAHIDR
jgi:hypothetical protein